MGYDWSDTGKSDLHFGENYPVEMAEISNQHFDKRGEKLAEGICANPPPRSSNCVPEQACGSIQKQYFSSE